ncbi:hypothetical protein PF002_g26055 [Phytophthora fragariae]|uniref:Uncharacterized protein n=1 Tax=Phytophthora fragariae TaxID=53985 RepID=A0A6A3WT88_9STRA|nr:hypothetical protein PF007_g25140 [Phytophthora fragariae]KAE9185839.1 hypothetical protein PF002_g26055 [Phytophthora fragariae]
MVVAPSEIAAAKAPKPLDTQFAAAKGSAIQESSTSFHGGSIKGRASKLLQLDGTVYCLWTPSFDPHVGGEQCGNKTQCPQTRREG